MNLIAPETCVDHYTFWRVHPDGGVDRTVTLQDQFQEQPFKRRLSTVEFLGNPTQKIRRGREEEDIHQAKVHLLAYRLEEPMEGPPTENPPIVRNQFNEEGEKWVLGKATFLLIPARKALSLEPPPTTPPPRRVDHYLCYEVVIPPPPVFEPLVLKDQFGTTDTQGLMPFLFGVPVIKNGEGLIHPDVHLAIYTLQPGLSVPPIGVNTADQLGRWFLSAIESVALGVPSHKEWKRL